MQSHKGDITMKSHEGDTTTKSHKGDITTKLHEGVKTKLHGDVITNKERVEALPFDKQRSSQSL
jgi:hypothetical protein